MSTDPKSNPKKEGIEKIRSDKNFKEVGFEPTSEEDAQFIKKLLKTDKEYHVIHYKSDPPGRFEIFIINFKSRLYPNAKLALSINLRVNQKGKIVLEFEEENRAAFFEGNKHFWIENRTYDTIEDVVKVVHKQSELNMKPLLREKKQESKKFSDEKDIKESIKKPSNLAWMEEWVEGCTQALLSGRLSRYLKSEFPLFGVLADYASQVMSNPDKYPESFESIKSAITNLRVILPKEKSLTRREIRSYIFTRLTDVDIGISNNSEFLQMTSELQEIIQREKKNLEAASSKGFYPSRQQENKTEKDQRKQALASKLKKSLEDKETEDQKPRSNL